MSTKTAEPGPVEREVRSRRILELLDEVQERLTLIRRQAEDQIETAAKTRKGSQHV
jgi:hypothetical protein